MLTASPVECSHRGRRVGTDRPIIGEARDRLKVLSCDLYGQCTTDYAGHAGHRVCASCPSATGNGEPKVHGMMSCVHRGDKKGTGKCISCGGRGKPVDIFNCTVHGECTVSRRVGSPKVCRVCNDRKPVDGATDIDAAIELANNATPHRVGKTVTFKVPLTHVSEAAAAKLAERGVKAVPDNRERIVLETDNRKMCAGDWIAFTASLRDLHKAHPNRFAVDVRCNHRSLLDHNPHVTALGDGRTVRFDYGAINKSNQRPVHGIEAFHESIGRALGVDIPVTKHAGDIHLSADERSGLKPEWGIEGPYWIIDAGWKSDWLTKAWPYYQDVVDRLAGRVRFVQIGAKSDHHTPLDGVVNLIGKTSLRDVLRLVHHSSGVLTPVSMPMHAAAAVPTRDGSLRPCVVIAGGREPAAWLTYPGHRVLENVGALPCCAHGACWKSKCEHMAEGFAKCMSKITADDVVRAVLSYERNDDGRDAGLAGRQADDCEHPTVAPGGRPEGQVEDGRGPSESGGHGGGGEQGEERADRRDRPIQRGRPSRSTDAGSRDDEPQEQAVLAPPRTMYIAANNSMARGYCLGDVAGMLKVVDLWLTNEPHDRVIMSLNDDDPLNFMWDGLIDRHGIEVVRDTLPRGNKIAEYELKGQRFRSRVVNGSPFDTYRELYPRMDGADRQGELCGKEAGLGRRNIVEYYYYGQQGAKDTCEGSMSYGPSLVNTTPWSGGNGRVFIAPHEKCQGNRHFTLAFWEDVVRSLLDRGVGVTVNSRSGFMAGFRHDDYRSIYPGFRELFDEVANHSVVACGNTGVGWVAGLTGTPLIAMEKAMIYSEYSFEKCGVESLRRTIREPSVHESVDAIMAVVGTTGVLH